MEIGTFLPTVTATRLSIAGVVRNRFVIAAVAAGVLALAAAWQWSWLVAIGAAPLLVSAAPCAAMCALGLCMHRIGSGSCDSQKPPIANSPDRTINDGEVT